MLPEGSLAQGDNSMRGQKVRHRGFYYFILFYKYHEYPSHGLVYSECVYGPDDK